MNSGRRDFFKTVGTAAAVATAASPILKPVESAAAVVTGKGTVPFLHSLVLEGTYAGFVQSFDGGDCVGQVLKEPVRPDGVVPKKIAGFYYNDLLISCGSDMTNEFYGWIRSYLGRDPRLLSGAIVSTDITLKPRMQLTFEDARISEVIFPKLDATSKEVAAIDLRLTPARTVNENPQAGAYPNGTKKMRAWLESNFKVTIGAIPAGDTWVKAVNAISVKQPAIGDPAVRDPSEISVEPLDIGPIVLIVPESRAQPYFDWHRQFVVQGASGAETTLSIEYVGANLRDVFATLKFDGVGIVRVTRMREDARTPGLRDVEVELYAEKVDLILNK